MPVDRKLLGKLVGVLGKTRMSSNINQLAKAANSGSLSVDEEMVKKLDQACLTIKWVGISVVSALKNDFSAVAKLEAIVQGQDLEDDS